MSGYWNTSPPVEVKAAILADWMDQLEDFKHETILYALRKWRNENPDKRPNPGHISAMLKDLWGRKVVKENPPMIAPEVRKPVSKERAAEILAQAGYRPRQFGESA